MCLCCTVIHLAALLSSGLVMASDLSHQVLETAESHSVSEIDQRQHTRNLVFDNAHGYESGSFTAGFATASPFGEFNSDVLSVITPFVHFDEWNTVCQLSKPFSQAMKSAVSLHLTPEKMTHSKFHQIPEPDMIDVYLSPPGSALCISPQRRDDSQYMREREWIRGKINLIPIDKPEKCMIGSLQYIPPHQLSVDMYSPGCSITGYEFYQEMKLRDTEFRVNSVITVLFSVDRKTARIIVHLKQPWILGDCEINVDHSPDHHIPLKEGSKHRIVDLIQQGWEPTRDNRLMIHRSGSLMRFRTCLNLYRNEYIED